MSPHNYQAASEPHLGEFEYAILRELPDEGRMAGYHPLVVTSGHVRARLNEHLDPGEPKVTTGQVGTACQILTKFGLVTRHFTVSGVLKGWQRTAEGAEAVAEHDRQAKREQQAAQATYQRPVGPLRARELGEALENPQPEESDADNGGTRDV